MFALEIEPDRYYHAVWLWVMEDMLHLLTMSRGPEGWAMAYACEGAPDEPALYTCSGEGEPPAHDLDWTMLQVWKSAQRIAGENGYDLSEVEKIPLACSGKDALPKLKLAAGPRRLKPVRKEGQAVQ